MDFTQNPYSSVMPRMMSTAVGTWAVRCDDGRVVTVNDPDSPRNQFRVGDMLLLVSWTPRGWINVANGILGHPGWAPSGEYDMDGGAFRLVVENGRVTETLVNESKRK